MTFNYILYIATLLLIGISGFMFGDGMLRWLMIDKLPDFFFPARVIVPFGCMAGLMLMMNIIRKEIEKSVDNELGKRDTGYREGRPK